MPMYQFNKACDPVLLETELAARSWNALYDGLVTHGIVDGTRDIFVFTTSALDSGDSQDLQDTIDSHVG